MVLTWKEIFMPPPFTWVGAVAGGLIMTLGGRDWVLPGLLAITIWFFALVGMAAVGKLWGRL